MTLKTKIVETAFAYLKETMHQEGLVIVPRAGGRGDALRYFADLGNGETVDLTTFREQGCPGLWLKMHGDGEKLPILDAFLSGNVLRARIGAIGTDDGPEIGHEPAVDFMKAMASRILTAAGAPFIMNEIVSGHSPMS